MSDMILFAHPTFGVLGILAAVWVFVEALNASEANQQRIWLAHQLAGHLEPSDLLVTVFGLGKHFEKT